MSDILLSSTRYKVQGIDKYRFLLTAVAHGNTLMFQVILHFATLLHIANKPSTNAQIHTVRAEDVCITRHIYRLAANSTFQPRLRSQDGDTLRIIFLH